MSQIEHVKTDLIIASPNLSVPHIPNGHRKRARAKASGPRCCGLGSSHQERRAAAFTLFSPLPFPHSQLSLVRLHYDGSKVPLSNVLSVHRVQTARFSWKFSFASESWMGPGNLCFKKGPALFSLGSVESTVLKWIPLPGLAAAPRSPAVMAREKYSLHCKSRHAHLCVQ